MIGKIQKLKNKKGFTIVELLIVIAIIGVLAAILIPLMSDYLNKARVTSANAAAASYRTQMTTFMTEAATEGKGRPESTDVANIYVTVDGSGNHATSSSDGAWGSNFDSGKLMTQLTNNMPDTKNASILFVLYKGTCVLTLFSPDKLSEADLDDYANTTDGRKVGLSDGISTGGYVVGAK